MTLDEARKLVEEEAKRQHMTISQYLGCRFPYSELSRYILDRMMGGTCDREDLRGAGGDQP